jgi:hypothetical protein
VISNLQEIVRLLGVALGPTVVGVLTGLALLAQLFAR